MYGGKGITVCDEWLNDPLAFVKYCRTLNGWDDPKLTIDRIKSDQDYKPGNIRFATHTVQARNIGLKSNNTTGYTGVYPKYNKFGSVIGVNYNQIRLGMFDTPILAAIARDQYIIDNNLEGYNLQVL